MGRRLSDPGLGESWDANGGILISFTIYFNFKQAEEQQQGP